MTSNVNNMPRAVLPARRRAALAVIACLFAPIIGLAGDEAAPLDDAFYAGLLSREPIQRDAYFETFTGKLFTGKGVVRSVEKIRRYDRDFRIIAEDNRENLKIRYYIFTGRERFARRLRPGAELAFEGILMLSTPFTLEKDAWILDILLSGD